MTSRPAVFPAGALRRGLSDLLTRAARRPSVAALRLAAGRPYEVLVAALQHWPMNGLAPTRRCPVAGHGPVGYVLLSDPGLTDTFVRREVEALRDAGVPVELFARASAEKAAPDHPAAPVAPVAPFGPLHAGQGRAAVVRYLWRKPVTLARLGLFVVRHRHHRDKTWRRDRHVLYEAALLADALRHRGVGRVHAPWANQSAILSFVAARLLDLPFSVQARASEIHRTVEAPRVADRIRFADVVITNSRYNECYLRGLLAGRRPPPIHVIYNGLDLSLVAPAAGRTEAGPAPFRILAVGRLVEPKGFDVLLTACAALREAGLEFTCEVIGGPQDEVDAVTWVELRRLLTRLSLESHVRFRGEQPLRETLEAFDRCDLFVLPCRRGRDGSHDITPNALIEAMALGLPVVSTTSGAIPEIVEDGVSGVLVPPGDATALASAIARLAGDRGQRDRLGAAARQKVEAQFDARRNARARVALFRGAEDGSGPPDQQEETP